MSKRLSIIITKQTVAEGFYLYLAGHKPNELFKECVSIRLPNVKTAYETCLTIEHVLKICGEKVDVYADKWAIEDVNGYCTHMAFEPFKEYKETKA